MNYDKNVSNEITIEIHKDLVLETSYYLYYIFLISLKQLENPDRNKI